MEFNRIVVWCLATGRQLSEAVETKDILESLMSSWIFFKNFFFGIFIAGDSLLLPIHKRISPHCKNK